MLDSSKTHSPLTELFDSGTHLTYKKGEFILRPGESPSGVFYIKTGFVKAYDITKYGEENLLIIRKEKEIFPLIWAITGQERSIIYQALSDVSVLRIDRKSLIQLIKDKPSVLEPLLTMTVEMYRIHSERIINLEYRTVKERLISLLLTMSQRFGQKKHNTAIINVPLRHQDIASSINASRETTSRELSALEKNGLISTDGLVKLNDVKKLKSFL